MHWARLAPELSATVTMVRKLNHFGLLAVLLQRSTEFDEAPALVLEIGRVSMKRMVSPMRHSVVLVVHLELGAATHIAPAVSLCLTRRSMDTTTVLSMRS